VNIDRNNRSGEKFTILGIVGWFGQFYDIRPPLSRYGIVNTTHVTARSCKKLIRLDAIEYKSQPGCGVSKTFY